MAWALITFLLFSFGWSCKPQKEEEDEAKSLSIRIPNFRSG